MDGSHPLYAGSAIVHFAHGAEKSATKLVFVIGVFTAFTLPKAIAAHTVEETIELHSGWNAVWFNIEPEPNDLVSFLAVQPSPLDCQAVWTFEPNRDVAANLSFVAPGRWLFYDKGVPAPLHTLRTFQGHRAYLILANVGGSLHLAGRPVNRSFSFSGRISNLFGAMSDAPAGILTFEKFFAHPNAAGKIMSSGAPIKHDIFTIIGGDFVRRHITDPIVPNKAYWINMVQDFAYAGPLDATSSANGMSFGRSTAIRTLSVDVPSSPISRTVTVQAHPCLELSGGGCNATTGGIEWLEYRVSSASPVPEWRPLTSGLNVLVPGGTTKINLDLRAKRATVSAVANVAGGSATLPPLVIDVSDDQGSRVLIPSDVVVEPIFGLWTGTAELTNVSVHPSIQEISLDQAVATPMDMTLILDLPSPTEVSGGAVPKLLDSITIQTFRDGRSLQRRLTAVLFDRPVVLAEEAGDPVDPLGTGGTLHGTLQILPEDQLNPYRHRYNPEHRQGYEIHRDITLTLDAGEESLVEQLAGLDGTFGPQRLNGVYTETITGLSQQPVTVQGTFRLEKIRGGAGNPLRP